MFLPWFGFDLGSAAQDIANSLGVSVNVDVPNANFNAWESYDFIDLILLLTVIAAVSAAIMSALATDVALPVAASALVAGLGILSIVLILFRIIDPVGDAGRKYGICLGLIAAPGSPTAAGARCRRRALRSATRPAAAGPLRAGRAAPPPPAPGRLSRTYRARERGGGEVNGGGRLAAAASTSARVGDPARRPGMTSR